MMKINESSTGRSGNGKVMDILIAGLFAGCSSSESDSSLLELLSFFLVLPAAGVAAACFTGACSRAYVESSET